MALYVFGIGGTGARVIKALTLLMASGVQVSNTNIIVPVLIDPDSANGDLARTLDLLRLYRSLRGYTEQDANKFFYNEIRPIAHVDEVEKTNEYHLSLIGGSSQPFKDLLGLNTMEPASKAMARMLFSSHNLESDMELGFKGNPNIGSVALNRFKDSDTFKAFAASFNSGDRIVIIGSIFGGTGAAGLPLLIKNIRNAGHSLPKHDLLRNAPIAAISVLPYFDVQGDTKIDSDTFISKTKAALSYYAANLCRNKSLNALYYLGDTVSNTYKGADGGKPQENNAHFVELAAAMAIVDFMKYDKADLAVEGGKAKAPMYFEYGLKQETDEIQLKHLGRQTFECAGKSLTQYFLFQKFLRNFYIQMPSNTAWMKNGNNKLELTALDKTMLNALERFNNIFDEWLNEMALSTTPFKPFRRDVQGEELLNAVIGFPEKKSMNPFDIRGLDRFVQILSKNEPGMQSLGNSERKLFALFYTATREIIKSRINL